MVKPANTQIIASAVFVLAGLVVAVVVALVLGVRPLATQPGVVRHTPVREIKVLAPHGSHGEHGDTHGAHDDGHGGHAEAHGGHAEAHSDHEEDHTSHADPHAADEHAPSPAAEPAHGESPHIEEAHEEALAPHEDVPAHPVDVEQLIRESLAHADTHAALSALEAGIATAHLNDDSAARVYTAMAWLCDSLNPPEPERQAKYFGLAASLAHAPETMGETARAEAEWMLSNANPAGAASRLVATLEALPPGAEQRPALRVLLGGALEAQSDLVKAEEAYTTALEEARAIADLPKRQDALRLAALHLSRLYRSTARHEPAADLAKQIQRELKPPPTPDPEPAPSTPHAEDAHAKPVEADHH
jgi:hypothetical protein